MQPAYAHFKARTPPPESARVVTKLIEEIATVAAAKAADQAAAKVIDRAVALAVEKVFISMIRVGRCLKRGSRNWRQQ